MLPTIDRAQLNVVPLTGLSRNPYLGADETAIVVALINSVTPRIVIEFGCHMGRTARAVLDHVPGIERYIGIDVPPDHRPTLRGQLLEIPRLPGLFVLDDKRFWLLAPERGSLTLTVHDLEPCDAVFIDADHSAIAVFHDSILARELIRPGGIIIWHDYGNPSVEVTGVLDDFHSEEHWPLVHVQGTWLVFMRT